MAINLNRPVLSLWCSASRRLQQWSAWHISRVFYSTCDRRKYCWIESAKNLKGTHAVWRGQDVHRSNLDHIPRRCQKTLSSSAMANTPSLKQMEHFLTSNKLTFEHGHTSIVATCPFCVKKKGKEMKKAKDGKVEPTLYVNKTTGSHFCKHCGTSGTWNELKIWIAGDTKNETHKPELKVPAKQSPVDQSERVLQIWKQTTPLTKSDSVTRKNVQRKFAIQKLTDDYLDRYQVHLAQYKFSEPDGSIREQMCVTFPWYDGSGSNIKGVKLVRIDDQSDSNNVTLELKKGFMGLFGWNAVPSDAKEIVLTLSEFDAIAVNQATSYPAISLPMGIQSLPPEVLPQLEQFERIILWFGNDVRARQAANQFSKKLNVQRCHFVRPTDENVPACALDALNKGNDLNAMLSEAQPIRHEKIVTFHQLRDEVYGELINADQVAGVKWTRFPQLNSILKGHRRGEMTIFTGPTGAGKTTLLSELSLDLSLQGVNTLWGSFEIRNVRLIKMMLSQLSGLRLETNIQQYNYWAEQFEALPMYFMSFYGGQNINAVIEDVATNLGIAVNVLSSKETLLVSQTMSHAAYVYDIEHVIVDNLQFMTSYVHRGDDKYSVQNQAIASLRHFASTKNVHVTLVIHPRKENEDVELQTASIFGTAKAGQEADNVLILQDKKGRSEKYLQVTKNRFDGVLGKVPLQFVRETLCMSGFGKSGAGGQKRVGDASSSQKQNVTPIVAADDNRKRFARFQGRATTMKRSAGQDENVPLRMSSTHPLWRKREQDTRAKERSVNTDLTTSFPRETATTVSAVPEVGNRREREGTTVTRSDGGNNDGAVLNKASAVRTAVNRMLKGTQLHTKAVNKTKEKAAMAARKAQAAQK